MVCPEAEDGITDFLMIYSLSMALMLYLSELNAGPPSTPRNSDGTPSATSSMILRQRIGPSRETDCQLGFVEISTKIFWKHLLFQDAFFLLGLVG